MRPDDRLLLRLIGTVHRDMLAEDIVISNFEPGRLPGVFQILWGFADHTAGEKAVVLTYPRQPGQIHVRPNNATGANFYSFVNDRIGPHGYRTIKLRFGMDDGRGMNHGSNDGSR